jgi:GTPase SAR1 family protein
MNVKGHLLWVTGNVSLLWALVWVLVAYIVYTQWVRLPNAVTQCQAQCQNVKSTVVKRIFFIGASGAGKSSLIRALIRSLEPDREPSDLPVQGHSRTPQTTALTQWAATRVDCESRTVFVLLMYDTRGLFDSYFPDEFQNVTRADLIVICDQSDRSSERFTTFLSEHVRKWFEAKLRVMLVMTKVDGMTDENKNFNLGVYQSEFLMHAKRGPMKLLAATGWNVHTQDYTAESGRTFYNVISKLLEQKLEE